MITMQILGLCLLMKIFLLGSLGYQKKICLATNEICFYEYRQQTSLIFSSRLSF